MDAKKKKQKQAHSSEHAISQDSLNEEFGPEFGDPNAAKAFENAIESNNNKNKKKNC
ncbi:hypothetical protein ACQCU1_09520 [Sutcliffiella horikoshii]|uniref:hypothetical protein n=1 Tax=Sutcliffiella horikoshii TaxID=79883 RepID=UPI003CE6E5DC